MPMHDWSHVDANVCHHFHQRWTIAICDVLNGGLLPPGYSALVEQHAGGLGPDVLALQRRSRPKPPSEPAGGVLTVTPPKTRHVMQTKTVLAALGNRIVIRHRLGDVVCMIEIVSPGNKSGRAALRTFVEKTVEFLRKGIHVLVIDLFPPTSRDPQGIHKAIWDEFEEEDLELPPDKPLTLVAYDAGPPRVAYVEPVAVGDVLPDMPLFLKPEFYVPAPLDATYQATWGVFPAPLKGLLRSSTLSPKP